MSGNDTFLVDQSLEYWNRIRGDRSLPRRADFDPTEIPRLLANVIFLDVIDEGADFRFRVIGDTIRAAQFENYAGRLLSSIPHVSDDGEVFAILRKAVRELRPVRAPVPYEGPNEKLEIRDQVALPFSDDSGRVTHVLLVIDLVDTRRK